MGSIALISKNEDKSVWLVPLYCLVKSFYVVAAHFFLPFVCRAFKENPVDSIQECQSLLDEPHLDTAIRAGDVYGLLIEHFAEIGQFEQVWGTACLELSFPMPNFAC
jgi:hypothetical protein